MINLQAQIDGRAWQVHERRPIATIDRVELIELIALRGQLLGRICDYEWVEQSAEQLARDTPQDAAAFVARARARSRFHRFTEALSDLDDAQRLGADGPVVDIERASVFQAIGQYEPAFSIYRDAAERQADFHSIAALATLHAECREIVIAEQLFDESLRRYRSVSPFPVALLEFQRGLMWLTERDLRRALIWFAAAVLHLPAYAPAQGHMAEVEAALGHTEAGISRLLSLTTTSDDPDYAASLARILHEVGRASEAEQWHIQAVARYDELLLRHPEAFADHAAEFWLEAGADTGRALELAKMNLAVRQTLRAHELFARAMDACETT